MSVVQNNESVSNASEQPKIDNSKEYNFAQIRKQLEQERQARIAAEERAKELESLRQQPQKNDDDDDDSDEPYVDRRILKKTLSKFEQNIEKRIDQKAEEKARMMLESDKQQNYVRQNPDFNQTLTAENIQKFAESHPAIAERMLRMPDGFDRQALLYEQIKAFNVQQKQKEEQNALQEKINSNARYPGYQPSGIPNAPYSFGGDFSPQGQKDAYQRMQELKARMKIG